MVFLPVHRTSPSRTYPDLLTNFLFFLYTHIWSAHPTAHSEYEKLAAIARQISLLLVGMIIFTSLRVVLRGVTRVWSFCRHSYRLFNKQHDRRYGSRAEAYPYRCFCFCWLKSWYVLFLKFVSHNPTPDVHASKGHLPPFDTRSDEVVIPSILIT